MSKIYLVKNECKKEIDSSVVLDLIRRYGIVGHTYNKYGQVIYIHSKDRKRIHSILISRY